MEFLPLVILILVDIILIFIATIFKIKQRIARVHKSDAARAFMKHASLTANRSTEYQPLTADTEYHGVEAGNLPLETRMPTIISSGLRSRPSGFAMLGEMGSNPTLSGHFNDPAAETTDLHLFVRLLKKCFGANSLGLRFEYENLKIQPWKATMPILDDVSGSIHAGSLWGGHGSFWCG